MIDNTNQQDTYFVHNNGNMVPTNGQVLPTRTISTPLHVDHSMFFRQGQTRLPVNAVFKGDTAHLPIYIDPTQQQQQHQQQQHHQQHHQQQQQFTDANTNILTPTSTITDNSMVYQSVDDLLSLSNNAGVHLSLDDGFAPCISQTDLCPPVFTLCKLDDAPQYGPGILGAALQEAGIE
jgi:hypothetical protein